MYLKTQIEPLLGKTKKFYAWRFYSLKKEEGVIDAFSKDRSSSHRQMPVVWGCGAISYASVSLYVYTKCGKNGVSHAKH